MTFKALEFFFSFYKFDLFIVNSFCMIGYFSMPSFFHNVGEYIIKDYTREANYLKAHGYGYIHGLHIQA